MQYVDHDSLQDLITAVVKRAVRDARLGDAGALAWLRTCYPRVADQLVRESEQTPTKPDIYRTCRKGNPVP